MNAPSIERARSADAPLPHWWSDAQLPSAYPDKTETVTLRQTHISWLFLLDRHVYKIRKPVRFSFVDFTRLENRFEDCRQELQVNRRLAPHVYIDVLPLVRTANGSYRFGGIGKPVEYAVRMVRLPDERSLEHVLQHRSLTKREWEMLVHVLVAFYQQLPPVTLTTDVYCARIARHVADNERDLSLRLPPVNQPLLQRVQQAQRLFLEVFRDELQMRVRDGRIVEGHGDLRPEHIYLTDPPVVIDAIEFSRELRELDVCDELAFLAMECDRLGHRKLGSDLWGEIRRRTVDPASDRLWNFYKTYRATVRAKVAALQAEQAASEQAIALRAQARDYLLLAEQYVESLAPPLMLIVSGVSGSGKSTLARQIASALGMDHHSTDLIRQELLAEGDASSDRHLRYSSNARQRVYEELFRLARQRLAMGISVILDGTFLYPNWRSQARQVAVECRALPVLIVCQCPMHVCQQRIRMRTDDPSEATAELVQDQWNSWRIVPDDQPVTQVDTTESMPVQLRVVYDALRERLVSNSISNKTGKLLD